MSDPYFCDLDIQFSWMNNVYNELRSAIKCNSWYSSPSKQCRIDINPNLTSIIAASLPFTISDCGIFKNNPGWKYGIHKDASRTVAINILLVDPCPDFDILYYSDIFDKTIPTIYERDVPKLLNTKKFHSVANRSLTITRYVMSIGHTGNSYEEIKKKFHNV